MTFKTGDIVKLRHTVCEGEWGSDEEYGVPDGGYGEYNPDEFPPGTLFRVIDWSYYDDETGEPYEEDGITVAPLVGTYEYSYSEIRPENFEPL
jgi:hypothetical protein